MPKTSSKSSLRIISGSLKGQTIASPNSPHTHPMGSREKLAMFNMIGDLLHGATVLDVFAGSGALGLEALSRGAKEVFFVECQLKVARVIQDNLVKLSRFRPQLLSEAQIFSEPLQKFSIRPEFQSYFDLILADPPYDHFQPEKLTVLPQLLYRGGRIVLSFPSYLNPPELPSLTLVSVRHYAAAGIAVYA